MWVRTGSTPAPAIPGSRPGRAMDVCHSSAPFAARACCSRLAIHAHAQVSLHPFAFRRAGAFFGVEVRQSLPAAS
eukprot:5404865-Lingulodinium_polyedra.AAC.1